MIVGHQFVEFTGLNLCYPIRVCDQRTTHCDEIELVGLHTRDEIVDARNLCLATAVGCDEFFGKPNAAYANSWFASELLHPACEVKVRAFEFRLPEAARAAVENIHAGI